MKHGIFYDIENKARLAINLESFNFQKTIQ